MERNEHEVSESELSDEFIISSTAEKWLRLSQDILKKGYWCRLGNLKKIMDSLPPDVEALYEEFEGRSSVRLNEDSRLRYYIDFTRSALGATTLHYRDVEALIQRKHPEIKMNSVDFLALITSKSHELCTDENQKSGNGEYVDFRVFVALIYDLISHHHEDLKRSKQGKWTVRDMLRQLPLDPDSGKKQAWDLACMVLLMYCSFSVPYGIAFDTEEEDQYIIKEAFDSMIDVIFLLDICLNFITGWDNQGFIVRDFSKIAKHYLRSWFLPDFAGSFPFDKVITALIDANRSTIASTTMLRGLRLVRMLKLIRAIKFMNKLEKLKQNEDFEAFGAIITLVSAMFFLFFTAHLLSCFYTILATYEEGDNWLLSYNPDLVNADAAARYIVSLYWAIITISTMGYGDILPVTHMERVFSIFVAVIGAVVFSYCLGTISTLITQVEGVDFRFQEKMRGIAEYMQHREMPADIKRKVRSYFTLCWRRSPAPFDEMQILGDLHGPLRTVLLRHIGSMARSEIPILQGFDDRCLGCVAANLRPAVFAQGEAVFQRGDRGDEMYFVVDGTVRLHAGPPAATAAAGSDPKEEQRAGKTLEGGGGGSTRRLVARQSEWVVGRGGVFGEGGLFTKGLGLLRRESAEAMSWLSVYVLTASGLQRIAAEYPEVEVRLREFATVRAMQARAAAERSAPADDGASAELMLRAARGVESGRPCKLQLQTAQVKADLIGLQEAEHLVPAAGPGASEVMRLLRPAAPKTGARSAGERLERETAGFSGQNPCSYQAPEAGMAPCSQTGHILDTDAALQSRDDEPLLGFSCTICASGKVLFLEHNVESLARGRPEQLGFVSRGQSSWRVLTELDTEIYGGSSRRRLYGCAITMYHIGGGVMDSSEPTQPIGVSSGILPSGSFFEQQLLTWSKDDFDDLCEILIDRLGPLSNKLLASIPQSNAKQRLQQNQALYQNENEALAAVDSTKARISSESVAHELASLEAELQIMAQESERLRQGMNRLLARTAEARKINNLARKTDDGRINHVRIETPAALHLDEALTRQTKWVEHSNSSAHNEDRFCNRSTSAHPMAAESNKHELRSQPLKFKSNGCSTELQCQRVSHESNRSSEPLDKIPETLERPESIVIFDALSACSTPAASAQQAAELKALADETCRLRRGLDRLLTVTETLHRPMPEEPEQGILSQTLFNTRLSDQGNFNVLSSAESGAAEERTLYLQERLLVAVEALLGEVQAGQCKPLPLPVAAASENLCIPSRGLPILSAVMKGAGGASGASLAAATEPGVVICAAAEDGERRDARHVPPASWAADVHMAVGISGQGSSDERGSADAAREGGSGTARTIQAGANEISAERRATCTDNPRAQHATTGTDVQCNGVLSRSMQFDCREGLPSTLDITVAAEPAAAAADAHKHRF